MADEERERRIEETLQALTESIKITTLNFHDMQDALENQPQPMTQHQRRAWEALRVALTGYLKALNRFLNFEQHTE